jgi:hypothetical protein
VAGAALLVGDVGQAESCSVDEFDEAVDAFGGGVAVSGEYGAGDLGAPGGDGLGEGLYLWDADYDRRYWWHSCPAWRDPGERYGTCRVRQEHHLRAMPRSGPARSKRVMLSVACKPTRRCHPGWVWVTASLAGTPKGCSASHRLRAGVLSGRKLRRH